jgi:hypothetical protein
VIVGATSSKSSMTMAGSEGLIVSGASPASHTSAAVMSSSWSGREGNVMAVGGSIAVQVTSKVGVT